MPVPLVCEQTGLTVEQLRSLHDAGLVTGALTDAQGELTSWFEDCVPERSQVATLLERLQTGP